MWRNPFKALGKRIFYHYGCAYPSRTDRFLDRIVKWMVVFSPKKGRERRKFKLRSKLYTLYYGSQVLRTAKHIGEGFVCRGPSCVNRNTVLGDYVCFMGMFINGGGPVSIGSHFHSGIQCMIITQNHDYDGGEMIPYGTRYIFKEVVIEDYVWFGRRVTILPGTHIGEGAIIQAGAVVHGEIPPYAIAGGNPAKVFKYRDIEQFQKLKAEGKGYTDELYCDLMFGDK